MWAKQATLVCGLDILLRIGQASRIRNPPCNRKGGTGHSSHTGVRNLLLNVNVGQISHEKVERSMRLFGEKVLPVVTS